MLTTIKTSQRNFITDPDRWLRQSLYFDNLFSGKWGDKQPDGSFFIETDADVFEHILRYLRSGVLPVFYDKEAGHDFPMYQALLEQLMYFAIDRLEKWIYKRKYLDPVQIHYMAIETQDRNFSQNNTVSDGKGRTFMLEGRFVEITASSNMEIMMTPMTLQGNTFYCPNGKHGKRDEEHCRSCIRQATEEGLSGYGGWRNEDQLKWCIVRKEVFFDHELCVNAFLEA
jgi:hypothetical protein